MKNYTLVKEHPDHFLLHNGVAHFKVAKSGLSEPTADKIRAFADGGAVQHANGQTRAGDKTQAENKAIMHGIDKKIGFKNPQKYTDGGKVRNEEVDTAPKEEKFPLQELPPSDLGEDYTPTPLPEPEKPEKRRRIETEMPSEEEQGFAFGGQTKQQPAEIGSLPGEQTQSNNIPMKFASGGKLDTNARSHIAPKNFAGPDRSYPIEDASHARNALARVSQHGSPELKAQVRAKVHAKYPGIEQQHLDDGGSVQSFQDSFRKATHYKDGGTISEQNPGVPPTIEESFKTPPSPGASETRDERYARIRANNTHQATSGDYDNGPIESHAKGGVIHSHTNAGKNQLHFHFYDGATIPTQLDKEEGAGPQQASPLDKYVGGEPAQGTPLDNYADGGDVQLSAQDVDPNAQIASTAPKDDTAQQIDQALAAQNPTPEMTANNLATAMGQPSPYAPTPNAGAPTTVPPQQQVPVARTPNAPGVDLMSQLTQATQQQKDALQMGETAKADYFDQQKDIITNQMTQQQKLYDTYQNTQKDNQLALDKLFKGVADSKVDPNRYWNQKSTGAKIAASIGLFLGGVAGGANGTNQNLALQNLQQHIAADIDAQKNDQTNQMNMYKLGLQKYHDTQAAYNFATLNANAMVAGQLQKAAATAGSAQAKAAAQAGIAQITQQSIPLQQSLAMHQVGLQMASGGAGTQNINPEMLSDDMRDRAVRLPNGNLGLSPTKEDAALSRKAFTSYSGIDQNLNNFLNTMKKIGPTINPWGADAATSESAKSNIVLELNKLHDLNRLNDNEFKTYMAMVPTAGTWRPNRATAQIMSLKQLIQSKQQAEMQNNIEGYKAPKFTPGPPK